MIITFHCGGYKTGTSGIQNYLFENRKSLLESNAILYPEIGVDTKNSQIGFRHFNLFNPSHDKLFEKLVQECRVANPERVVLSWEGLSRGNFAREVLPKCIRDLRQEFSAKFEGVVYFRNIDDYARSLYREWVRRGGVKSSFSEFIGSRPDFFDYLALAQAYQKCHFDVMEYYSYDETGDTKKHFFDRLGVCDGSVKINKITNKGLSSFDIQITRYVNQKIKPRFRAKLTEHLLEKSPFKNWSNQIKEQTDIPRLNLTQGDQDEFAKLTGLSEEHVKNIFNKSALKKEETLSYYMPEINAYCDRETKFFLGK